MQSWGSSGMLQFLLFTCLKREWALRLFDALLWKLVGLHLALKLMRDLDYDTKFVDPGL